MATFTDETSKIKARKMLYLARQLGIDDRDPKQMFGFALGCTHVPVFRQNGQVYQST